MSDLVTEVCVVGGGPAGSSFAKRMAELGHAVCLLERCAFPRHHVGESLPPSILPVLGVLGVQHIVEQVGFLRPRGAKVQWSSAEPLWKDTPGEPGFQVDRSRFDALLLRAAANAGVRVLQPASVSHPRHQQGTWQIPYKTPAGGGVIAAKFMVDATGKRSSLPHQRRRTSVKTAALYGYWHGLAPRAPETLIEVGDSHWYWGAPLPDGTLNACVFLEPKRCAGLSAASRRQSYVELLERSELLRFCTRGELRDGVRVADATSYQDLDPISESRIKIGEAAYSIDPLSSQGVQAAMASAFTASVVVHTMLHHPERGDAARELYLARQHSQVRRHALWAATHYGDHARLADDFFAARAVHSFPAPPPLQLRTESLQADTPLSVSAEVRLQRVPIIVGNVVELAEGILHPSMTEPLVFLGDVHVAGLVQRFEPGSTASATLAQFARTVPGPRALQLLRWLWQHRLLVEADGKGGPRQGA